MDFPIKRRTHATKAKVPTDAPERPQSINPTRARVRPGSVPEPGDVADTEGTMGGIGQIGASHYSGPALAVTAYNTTGNAKQTNNAQSSGSFNAADAMDDPRVYRDLFGVEWS